MSTLVLPARLIRFARYIVPAGSSAKIAERLFRRATIARNAGHHLAAAILYEEALGFTPGLSRIHIQAGHMFKEAGDFERAEMHYRTANDLTPDNADLALQFGHFFKLSGQPERAITAYRRALALQPGLTDAADELSAIEHIEEDRRTRAAEREGVDGAGPEQDGPISELLPRAPTTTDRSYRDGLNVQQLGRRRERTRWGMMKTLRGIEAIRGHCISAIPVLTIQILVDDIVLHAGPLESTPIDGARDQSKYVFNIWLDFSGFAPGRYDVEVRCTDARRRVRQHRQTIVIAAPASEATWPSSDAVVTVAFDDSRSIEERVNARPSVVRPAERTLMTAAPRAVLVQRVDQLGDLVVSVPAIRRLRALFPAARLVGLLSPANVDLGRALALFDDVVVADYPEDPRTGRRSMTATAQQDLRRVLATYSFDMAIDLCENGGSRPLLLLSGAPFLYGFRTVDAPWLTADVTGSSLDPVNRIESAAHSAKLTALVDWLGALVHRQDRVERRADDGRNRLAPYGLATDKRFVLLHVGARLAFSRWGGFEALAERLLARTDLHIVVMADAAVPEIPLQDARWLGRLHRITGRIPFDDFDALLSCAAVFVGNDSGPKHLAALRGTPVVSIHMARLNWNEWGQANGLVISRRVPCAGCGIHDAPKECGKDFACITAIQPDEVFDAVMRLLT